ncbi:uncharacterized protein N7482_004023 [Penicillium canariense]|uniref:Uncharacterized protein n=1 Tax=Penicillium canariense TaxID=189055 RepID=A0A9W9LNZ8_9EURO|nr:uncharacterized protein N7482_004023 [Penicillium canariense]KAJ5168429.1 hypothetical protein N7482_004023 [Penicillium canariense]
MGLMEPSWGVVQVLAEAPAARRRTQNPDFKVLDVQVGLGSKNLVVPASAVQLATGNPRRCSMAGTMDRLWTRLRAMETGSFPCDPFEGQTRTAPQK